MSVSHSPVSRAYVLLLVAGVSATLSFGVRDSAAGGGEIRLIWHVERLDGEVLNSADADASINPASVVKVATSLWALDRLGAGHRFETRFATSGRLDESGGILRGDLLVRGSGDPDFHVENAYLVARALNEHGVREVEGVLRVSDDFWIGWEGGSERRIDDPARRARLMASRLRDALDPRRWNSATRRAVDELRARRGWEPEPVPRVVIDGGVGRVAGAVPTSTLVVHRSNPLLRTLKRFDSYSNNDIERLGSTLGPPDELARYLNQRWPGDGRSVVFATLSGLGTNRMTPRQIVRLLHDARDDLAEDGPERILPVAGCDPGTLEHFPSFGTEAFSGALIAKTGTLTRTDGGVAVLAGYLHTRDGTLVFCVAAPSNGSRLTAARAAQDRWLADLAAEHGGPQPRPCGPAPGFSDDEATVVVGSAATTP
jgi:D-alanyl-D-alanine carboxypeptidase/D-alanyl-D-alanine-endopeptidase (penicillin-binding protein 4)